MNTDDVRRKYHRNARFYDLLIRGTTEALRREAVSRLRLRPGARVLDLGAGTGLSLPHLRAVVGAAGHVYAIELSEDMLAVATGKVRAAGWTNVELIRGDAQRFELPESVDGVLCFFTHDIMMSPSALSNAVRHLKVGGRLVAAGSKLARGWRGALMNPITQAYSRAFITTAHSSEPYALMRDLVSQFSVEERMLGSQYLAVGRRTES